MWPVCRQFDSLELYDKHTVTYLVVTVDGVWIGEWIDPLYTPLGTASNHNTIAELHTLQITIAPAKPFPVCCIFTSRSLATASNSGDASVSRAQVLLSQPPVQNFCQLLTQLQRHLFSASLAELNWLPTLNWIDCPNSLLYNHFARTE
jgi:hypothetical protein